MLRAVNVGGRNKVAMGELRSLLESLGHTDVSTYIQSGNVVFTAAAPVEPAVLEAAIADRFGLAIDVVVRTAAELRQVVAANPFPDADLSTLHVGFMVREPTPGALGALDHERFRPDEFAFHRCEVYLHLPDGMGRAKLPGYLDRQLKIPWTARNWNTILKLLELAGG